VERLLPEDAIGRVRDAIAVGFREFNASVRYSIACLSIATWKPQPDSIGDAIATAVLPAIADALPHGHSDPCPFCDAFLANRFDHRSLSSGTADDWHGMDRPQGSSGR
jgi:hypothetical protein